LNEAVEFRRIQLIRTPPLSGGGEIFNLSKTMTDHQRKTVNKEVLDAADAQVARVESEISRLGRLEEDLHASRETVEKLSLEALKIRDNVDSIPKEKRMAKLRDNAATIDLEQGDARKTEANITLAKARVVAVGEAAKASGAEILWALTAARQANAKAALEALLDMSLLGAHGENLEATARSLIELRDLENFFNHYLHADEGDRNIFLLRSLRERFTELRVLCENEPGLSLPPITVRQAIESTGAAEAKPATMAAALVVA
jgi:hypothetical protein